MNKRTLGVVSAIFLFLQTGLAFANATRFSVVDFHPAPDGGEYFTIEGSTPLYSLQWTAGTMLDMAYKPLVEESSGRKIIEYMLIQHFYGAVGITDWLSFGLDVPAAWVNYFSNPDVATAPQQNHTTLSDPVFQFKVSVLDGACYPVGLAVVPFLTVPLGNKDYFAGSDGFTGGAKLVLDAEFKKKLWLALNVGASVHKYVSWRNMDQNAVSVLMGVGAAYRAIEPLSLNLELTTTTPSNHFFSQKEESPTEVLGGVKYNIGKTGLRISAGAGTGILKGGGAPTVRGFAGLSYTRAETRTHGNP